MAALVAAAMTEAGCLPVRAIGGHAASLRSLGLDVVADEWPGEGPLGAVVTALQAFPSHRAVVVAACDLPRLTAATIRALADELAAHDEALVVMAEGGRLQPLCAVWRPAAVTALATCFAAGERSMFGALASVATRALTVNHQDLANVNTPRDLSL
jgi:molybdopterin-guanine dinucleotide biosynthesis protein A